MGFSVLDFYLFVVVVFGVPYLKSFNFSCGSESQNEILHKSLGSCLFRFVGGGDDKAYFVSLCNIVRDCLKPQSLLLAEDTSCNSLV